jgi:hypothetical protein
MASSFVMVDETTPKAVGIGSGRAAALPFTFRMRQLTRCSEKPDASGFVPGTDSDGYASAMLPHTPAAHRWESWTTSDHLGRMRLPPTADGFSRAGSRTRSKGVVPTDEVPRRDRFQTWRSNR